MSLKSYWTEDLIHKVALKCKSRNEFRKRYSTAYARACKLKILDKVCSHMVKVYYNAYNFTYEDVLKKGKKCRSYNEFISENKSEYRFLQVKKLLKKFKQQCKYETAQGGTSTGEKSMLRYINKLLNINLKKRDRIPWLKSDKGQMSLDGYDEKNKIAFEFNGRWHLNEDVKKRDKMKVKSCKKMKITLIVIEDYYSNLFCNHYQHLIKQLFKKLKKLKLKIKNPNAKFKIIYNGAYFTHKEIDNAIKKSTSFKDFRDKNPKIYSYLIKHKKQKILDSIPGRRSDKKPEKQYPKDKIIEIAKQYTSYKDFRNNAVLYKITSKFGMLDEVKKLYPGTRRYVSDMSEEEILAYALTCKNLQEFRKRSKVYKQAGKLGIREKIKSIYFKKPLKITMWTEEILIKTVKKYKSYTEFCAKEPTAYKYAKKRKILDKLKSNFAKIPKKRNNWTDDSVITEARKYKLVNQFMRLSSGAYKFAIKSLRKDEIFKHFPKPKITQKDLSTADIWNIVIEQCQVYRDFGRKHITAWKAARKLGILDEIKIYFAKKNRS